MIRRSIGAESLALLAFSGDKSGGRASPIYKAQKWTFAVNLALDVLNLEDRKNNDISYYYISRVPGEPIGGVDGVHVHPAVPRTIRLT